jgi:hypothetical protein
MRYEEREDGELVELAQAGWSPAFAVLVHRHGPALLAAFADEPDPAERTFEVLVRAMRRLDKRDPAQPVRPWLFALAGRDEPATVPPPVGATLDHVWRDLAERWPDGKRPRRRHPILAGIAIALGAIALGVGVPTIVLGLPDAPEEPPESVRAQPLEEVPVDEPEPIDMPDFEFPDIAEGPAPAPSVPSGPAAPAVTEPAEPVAPVTPPPTAPAPTDPDPVPAPDPAPAPQPEPEPEPEPQPDPPPVTDGDGTGDDVSATDGGDTSAGSEGVG